VKFGLLSAVLYFSQISKKVLDQAKFFCIMTLALMYEMNRGLSLYRAHRQKDIAEKLNVSVMTVSKALKGQPDIS
jgi:DNA-binding MarR family transcriptional regulator